MSDRAPRTCYRCGDKGHDIRTWEEPLAMSDFRSSSGCDEDCLTIWGLTPALSETGGIERPE